MQFTLTDLWHHMGLFARLIVAVLAVMSVASLVVMAERLIVFSRSRSESRNFAEKMASTLAKDDLTTAAGTKLGQGRRPPGPGHRRGPHRVPALRRKNKDVAVESVARALERQAAARGAEPQARPRAARHRRLHRAVRRPARHRDGYRERLPVDGATGSGGLGTVSAGIAEALITTAFGLLVAIPAVMAYNFLQGWVDARAVDISESSNEFLDVGRQVGRRHSAAAAAGR